MNELLNVLLVMALAVSILLGVAGTIGLIVGLVVWRRVDTVTAQANLAFANVGAQMNQVHGLAKAAADGVNDLAADLDMGPEPVTPVRMH